MRPRLLGLLAALVLTVLVPAPAGAATHWPGEPSARLSTGSCTPDGRTCVSIQGRGFGHGHGMSQYGAKGAAEAGLTWDRIVAFYYPGTVLSAFTGSGRVLVSADTVDTVVLAQTGLRFRDLANGAVITLPTNLGATQWKLHPNTSTVPNKVQLSWFNGSWHAYKLLAGNGEFFGSTPLTLVLPNKVQRRYRATLRYVLQLPTSRTVNVLPVDSYVRGVVPREMPALWAADAVRAQAVAARTYALHERQARLGQPWEICDTTQCQVYGGYDAEHPASNDAVVKTAGQFLAYSGQPAFTQFSASNGGWSAAGSQPYLVARKDPYDGYPSWTVAVSTGGLRARYPQVGSITGLQVVKRDGKGDVDSNGVLDGRVVTLRVTGTTGTVDVSGESARSLLGLKSTLFRIL